MKECRVSAVSASDHLLLGDRTSLRPTLAFLTFQEDFYEAPKFAPDTSQHCSYLTEAGLPRLVPLPGLEFAVPHCLHHEGDQVEEDPGKGQDDNKEQSRALQCK